MDLSCVPNHIVQWADFKNSNTHRFPGSRYTITGIASFFRRSGSHITWHQVSRAWISVFLK